MHTDTQTHTHTHKHKHANTHTNTHTYTHTHKHTHKHTHTQTHAHGSTPLNRGAARCTVRNLNDTQQTSMPSAGFEAAIRATRAAYLRPHGHLDRQHIDADS